MLPAWYTHGSVFERMLIGPDRRNHRARSPYLPNRKPTPAGKLKVGLLNKKRCADSSTPLAPWQDVCSVAQRAAEDPLPINFDNRHLNDPSDSCSSLPHHTIAAVRSGHSLPLYQRLQVTARLPLQGAQRAGLLTPVATGYCQYRRRRLPPRLLPNTLTSAGSSGALIHRIVLTPALICEEGRSHAS